MKHLPIIESKDFLRSTEQAHKSFRAVKEAVMTKKLWLPILVVASLAILTGCMNMPTPTSQITGYYISGLRYEDFNCSRLAVELNSLARRESQLVIAQGQRIKTSQIQAFWWGFGQGDGIEASELANIRGEKEAVLKAMEAKGCQQPPESKGQTER